MSTCLHCPDHCPPERIADPDLRLPRFPGRGGGKGNGTTTDVGFYRALGAAYSIARERYPVAPAKAVLLANPNVSEVRLRRALHRAVQLGELPRVRSAGDPVAVKPAGKSKGKAGAAVTEVKRPPHPGLPVFLDSKLGVYADSSPLRRNAVSVAALMGTGLALDEEDGEWLLATIQEHYASSTI